MLRAIVQETEVHTESRIRRPVCIAFTGRRSYRMRVRNVEQLAGLPKDQADMLSKIGSGGKSMQNGHDLFGWLQNFVFFPEFL